MWLPIRGNAKSSRRRFDEIASTANQTPWMGVVHQGKM
jgi:hypothetical protein